MKAQTDAIHASNIPCTTRWTTQAGLPGRRCMRYRCKDSLASALLMAIAVATGWAQPANANSFDADVHLTIMEARIPEGVFGSQHASVRLEFDFMGARHDPSKPLMVDRTDGGTVRSIVSLLVSTLDGNDNGNEDPGAWLSLSFGPQAPDQDLDTSSDAPDGWRSASQSADPPPRSDSERRKGPDGFTIEAGYSMSTFSGHFSSTPYAGLSASGETTLGWRFAAKRHDLDFAVVATRHEGTGTGHHLGLEFSMRW